MGLVFVCVSDVGDVYFLECFVYDDFADDFVFSCVFCFVECLVCFVNHCLCAE